MENKYRMKTASENKFFFLKFINLNAVCQVMFDSITEDFADSTKPRHEHNPPERITYLRK